LLHFLPGLQLQDFIKPWDSADGFYNGLAYNSKFLEAVSTWYSFFSCWRNGQYLADALLTRRLLLLPFLQGQGFCWQTLQHIFVLLLTVPVLNRFLSRTETLLRRCFQFWQTYYWRCGCWNHPPFKFRDSADKLYSRDQGTTLSPGWIVKDFVAK